ncbi:MAG: hypothetical protein HY706_20350 [Candidatus Hydrogenedentes bacterium]|nr:hypothetical protein [Candidatus Hydrogenedentota bacterium]
MSGVGQERADGVSRFVPTEVNGWTPAAPDHIYNADTLYTYIDGSAEVYRAFNVRRVFARRFAKPKAPDILADVFDMGSPEDAYGAYHHDVREGETAGIGEESEYNSGSLFFWKGSYFVSIVPFDETEAAEHAVLKLGRAIAERIQGPSRQPAILKRLPADGRVENRVHYFHEATCLNTHYYLADANLLQLDKKTEGVVARYRPATSADKTSYVVVLIRYPKTAAADAAYESFRKAYLPDSDTDGLAQTENRRWAGTRRHGKILAVVFDAPEREEVIRMFSALLGHSAFSRDRK